MDQVHPQLLPLQPRVLKVVAPAEVMPIVAVSTARAMVLVSKSSLPLGCLLARSADDQVGRQISPNSQTNKLELENVICIE